jgi:hypothetical protein
LIDCRYGGREYRGMESFKIVVARREARKAAHKRQILRCVGNSANPRLFHSFPLFPLLVPRQLFPLLCQVTFSLSMPSPSLLPPRRLLPSLFLRHSPIGYTLRHPRRTFPPTRALVCCYRFFLHQGRVTLAFLPSQSSDATTTTP